MDNIALEVEYIGKNYSGFQKQPDVPTIEGELEKALYKTFNNDIKLVYAGRTDAGVHAFGQVISFYADNKIDIGNLPKVLNYHLPEDISISSAKVVPYDFHARFSAKSKVYRYIIYNNRYRSAIYGDFSYCYPHKLDENLMNEALKYIIGEHDFTSFMGRDSEVKDAIREVYSASVKRDGDFLYIDFHGKAFLRNMIRIIVGSLCDIGRGKLPIDFLKKAMDEKRRDASGYTAPASGLYLMEVKY